MLQMSLKDYEYKPWIMVFCQYQMCVKQMNNLNSKQTLLAFCWVKVLLQTAYKSWSRLDMFSKLTLGCQDENIKPILNLQISTT